MNQKDTLNEGLNKVYALIFKNYCTKGMQAKIEEHPDFDAKIKDNPIELLETIKVLMQDSVWAVNPMIPLLDTMS